LRLLAGALDEDERLAVVDDGHTGEEVAVLQDGDEAAVLVGDGARRRGHRLEQVARAEARADGREIRADRLAGVETLVALRAEPLERRGAVGERAARRTQRRLDAEERAIEIARLGRGGLGDGALRGASGVGRGAREVFTLLRREAGVDV